MTNRIIVESPIAQGANEIITYQLTTTPWGSNPTGVEVTVYDITDAKAVADWEDVTATVMPTNTPGVAGDVITLSPLKLLTNGHLYRVEIQFTCGANTFETFCLVNGGE